MIDMHIHTTCSDGSDSAEMVMKKAYDIGLCCISITDHNSVDAYYDLDPSEHFKIIPGVEITCMYKGEVVEVLGYGFDILAMRDELHRNMLSFEEKQKKEFQLICKAFSDVGVIFNKDDIRFNPKIESSRKAFLKEIKKYESNRQFFSADESWDSSRYFTRKEIYNPSSKLYVDESSLYPKIKDAVDMIHRSRGIALLAHLYEYKHCMEFRNELKGIVDNNGLDGVECAHSSFTSEQIVDLNKFCDDNNLLKSGGSDYHGSRKPDISLGTGRGNLNISEDYISSWPKCIKPL